MGGELIEIEKNAGYQAVLTYLQDYTKKIRDIQEKYAFSNRDIMSPKLIENSKLSLEEMTALEELKRKLDHVIHEVAERVEKHRLVSYDDHIQKYELNSYDKLRVNSLVRSVQDINKSIQKLKFAVEAFSRCNKDIIRNLDECIKMGDYPKSKMFVLGNILLIFELANYLVNFLEKFEIEGIHDIRGLSESELKKISDAVEDLDKLKGEANIPSTDDIDDQVKRKILSDLNDREEALKEFKKQWDDYITVINGVGDNVGGVKKQVQTLKLIRDNAKNQLEFFEIMKIFGVMMIAETVRKSLEPLEIDLLPLHEIELISLPPHKVEHLIGLSREHGSIQMG